ncbi:MAG: hypothetical protein ACRD0P_02640 [Stackebrandtia sp.]
MAAAPPRPVRLAVNLLLLAIAAGAAETLLFVAQAFTTGAWDGIAVQVAVRLVIYAGLSLLVLRLRAGQNRTRVVVAVVIGGFGTLSMVVSPIAWLAAGNSPAAFLSGADGWTLAFTCLRAAHVVAVLASMVYLFHPTASAFYRPRPQPTQGVPERT